MEKIKITEQEAIEAIKSNKPTGGYLILCGALDMAISALEKQIPKKPIEPMEEYKRCRFKLRI